MKVVGLHFGNMLACLVQTYIVTTFQDVKVRLILTPRKFIIILRRQKFWTVKLNFLLVKRTENVSRS